jgi:glycosyltransferase involved in cell wall biosynthesis
MRLVTALLVKDEADKYLTRVLERCLSFSDEVLVLDDGSTDDTVKIATELGCLVKQRPQTGAWGNESPARAELWDRGAKLAKDGWLLICDGDQILHGDPRPLCDTWEFNSWGFVLLDMWSETEFRTDGFWQAHLHPRPWLFKPSAFGPDFVPQWGNRGIHCGHYPPNAPLACGIAPPDQYYWQHYSYSTAEQRRMKYEQYRSVAHQLTPAEKAHAESIMD